MKKQRINPYNLFVGAFVPNWLMKRTELSAWAKLTYARLGQYAGKDGEAFPTVETIAEEIGASKSTVERALAELKKADLIESVQRGLNKSNSYFFLAHQWMKQAVLKDHEPSPVTYPETSTLTDQECPPVTYIRESEEENQLKDHSEPDGSREPHAPRGLKDKFEKKFGPRWKQHSGKSLTDLLEESITLARGARQQQRKQA